MSRILEQRVKRVERQLQNLPTSDPFLTVAQVAEKLQIGKNRAYDLFARPSFPGKKIPGVGYRVRASKLYDFFDNYNTD